MNAFLAAALLVGGRTWAVTAERAWACARGGSTIERFVDEDDDGMAERIEYADAESGFVIATLHFEGERFGHAVALGVRYETAGEPEGATHSPCALLKAWRDAGKKGV